MLSQVLILVQLPKRITCRVESAREGKQENAAEIPSNSKKSICMHDWLDKDLPKMNFCHDTTNKIN